MISCPSCHKSVEILEQHMGTLFTCPHCNAVYFINFDGQPEMADHEAEANQADIAPSFSNDAVSTENYSSPSSDFSNFENPDGFNNSDFTSPPEQVSEPEPEAIIESPSFSESPALNEPPAFNEPPMQIPTSGVSDTADFNDVTDFANTTASVGSLTYVVVIDGIDSSQLVYQLKEAMTDSRFGWDVAETLAQMSGGRLVLTGMNSAKAAVLINRIKYLPFKISWRQDVLSGS